MRDIPKQAQHTIAVMREIRVQPHPAPIAALIKPRNRIPTRASGPPRDAEPMFGAKLNRGMTHIHRNALRRTTTPLMDHRGCKPRRCDACLRRRIHPKAGRLDGLRAGQADLRKRGRIKRGVLPQCAEDVGWAWVHGTSFHRQRHQVQPLVVRLMLTFPKAKLPPRATRFLFGGPIHAAVGNQQQRPDH